MLKAKVDKREPKTAELVSAPAITEERRIFDLLGNAVCGGENPLRTDERRAAQILVHRIDERHLPAPLAVLAVFAAHDARLSIVRVPVRCEIPAVAALRAIVRDRFDRVAGVDRLLLREFAEFIGADFDWNQFAAQNQSLRRLVGGVATCPRHRQLVVVVVARRRFDLFDEESTGRATRSLHTAHVFRVDGRARGRRRGGDRRLRRHIVHRRRIGRHVIAGRHHRLRIVRRYLRLRLLRNRRVILRRQWLIGVWLHGNGNGQRVVARWRRHRIVCVRLLQIVRGDRLQRWHLVAARIRIRVVVAVGHVLRYRLLRILRIHEHRERVVAHHHALHLVDARLRRTARRARLRALEQIGHFGIAEARETEQTDDARSGTLFAVVGRLRGGRQERRRGPGGRPRRRSRRRQRRPRLGSRRGCRQFRIVAANVSLFAIGRRHHDRRRLAECSQHIQQTKTGTLLRLRLQSEREWESVDRWNSMHSAQTYRLRSWCGSLGVAILVGLAARALVRAESFRVEFVAEQRHEAADAVTGARMPIDAATRAAHFH